MKATIAANNLKLSARRWKFDSNGQMDFETQETLLHNQVASLTDNSFIATTGVDNTGSGFIGGAFEGVRPE